MHLRLDGVNNFRKTIKLPFHTSVTVFVLNCQVLYHSFIDSATHDQIIKEFPESTSNKEVSFYLFEIKEEYSYKNGIKICTTELQELTIKKVSKIVRMLLVQSSVYFRHRWKVLPLIKEAFNGRYIELVFSENLAMKGKFEAQDAHFSGK